MKSQGDFSLPDGVPSTVPITDVGLRLPRKGGRTCNVLSDDRKLGRPVSHRCGPAGWLELVAMRPNLSVVPLGWCLAQPSCTTAAPERFDLLSLAKGLASHVIAAWPPRSCIAWPISSVAPSTQTCDPWRSLCWSPTQRFVEKADIQQPGRRHRTIHTPAD